MDYAAFLSERALRRKPSAIREMYDKIDSTYTIMAGGRPNPDIFQIRTATLKLQDGSEVKVSEEDMLVGQQYGHTIGHPEMIKLVKDLTKRLHDPPTLDNPSHPGLLSLSLSTGSQHGIYEVFDSIINEGDTVLTTSVTYPVLLDVVRPLGGKVVGLKTDIHGIVIESLRDVLSQWPKPDDNKPSRGTLKALYCVPNSCNPTGLRFSVKRKQEVYNLAREYNFLIVEDDAYFMLEERPHTKSFLSMDEDGRVLRLDTFSKTFAPGLRLGVIAGPGPIQEKVKCLAQCSTQGCANMSQCPTLLLRRYCSCKSPGRYLEHCERLNHFYAERRRKCEALAKKYLGDKGLAEWDSPTGGMFLWIRLIGVKDARTFVVERLVGDRKLVIVPGDGFIVDSGLTEYVRISFSIVTEEIMEKAFIIMAEELEKFREEQSAK